MALGTVMLIALVAASPDPRAGIAECARHRGDLVRLDCYDRLARDLGVAAAQQGQVRTGKWRLSSGTSALDDSPTVIAQLAADEEVRRWPSKKTVRPMLILQCDQGHLDLYVYTGMTGDGGRTTITHRLDAQEAVTQEWDNADSRDAVFYDPLLGANTSTIVEALSTHRTMLLQFTPHRGVPTMVTFSLQGAGDVVPKLRAACPNALKGDAAR